MSARTRPRFGTAAAIVAAMIGALAACADVAGLDGLVEDDCPADGCTDAAPQSIDAAAPADVVIDQFADTSTIADAGTRDGAPFDTSVPDDAVADATDSTTPDVSVPDASVPDATLDAAPDAGGPCGTVYFAETFSSAAQGWSLDTSWSIAPTCATPPAPQKGFPDPTSDHTAASTDNGVAGAYVCGNNPATTTNAPRYLTSPIVDTAGATSLKLTFYRWLNSDSATYMASTVDVYDGAAWVNLYTNPTTAGSYVTDSAWTAFEYDLGAYANAAMRVRFGYSVLSTSVYEMSSWNIDDVTISALAYP